jgi:hypothetical protein
MISLQIVSRKKSINRDKTATAKNLLNFSFAQLFRISLQTRQREKSSQVSLRRNEKLKCVSIAGKLVSLGHSER